MIFEGLHSYIPVDRDDHKLMDDKTEWYITIFATIIADELPPVELTNRPPRVKSRWNTAPTVPYFQKQTTPHNVKRPS